MSVQTILQNNKYRIDVFSGQVTDYNQRIETEITGGHYSRIGSVTHTHTQIFIVDEQNQEYSFNTRNWDIPIRAGHKLNVFGLFTTGTNSGDVVAVKNINLNQYYIQGLEIAVKSMYRPSLKWGLISLFVLPFVLFFMLFAFQPEPNGFIATLFTLLIVICQLFGLGSLIYGYHIRWRHQYSEIKKSIQMYL